MNDQALFYALSTLAQTAAALAAFVGALGLFRLQMLRDRSARAEFEYRALVQQGTGRDMYQQRIRDVVASESTITQTAANAALRREISETRATWEAFEPRVRRTTATLVIFEAWILFVILISLGGLAHIPALACWRWSSVALWCIAILTVLSTGGSVFVWLEVRDWMRRRAV